MSLTASGCMTVHGELEVVPSATKAEAAQALAAFTDAYNKADKAYDPALDEGRVTGSLGAINQAGLKARHITTPAGNAQHSDMTLSDAKFLIPKKAGWPRWFVADTDSNRDRNNRWLVVFVKNAAGQPWRAAYLSVVAPSALPAFVTDKDGWAEPVEPAGHSLAVAPKDLSAQYASYLQSGKPAHFAPGPNTSLWRAAREKNANLPTLSTQYVDRPLTDGDYRPLGLATRDGGALVFFSTRHFEQQTAAKGLHLTVPADVKALTTGDARTTITKERVAGEVALVPAEGQVNVLNRLQGLTAAKGS
ncbi:hypothetical protein OG204_09615 [Streptomyces sp. NBC_01387]|uniref:hypothetical protein n=1 Tax=unclassified Streptomyces TaxID=2593676 RepID=UPI0020243622|nr:MULTISPECIES: hypothetical protein [unclassified Streptomyces]MCX4551451.1 hypothetical protein [Streptomyces sp. NBC_01500]WSV58753.1 hypothetical protein OG282_25425 [Streptomyces sp. NBC_01014]